MKIIYDQNPLKSIIELNDDEKRILKLNIKIDALYDGIYDALYYIDTDLDLTKQSLTNCVQSEVVENNINLDEEVEQMYDSLIDSITQSHNGDCICEPMTCAKCLAEGFIGISTTKGINKYALYYISSAFGDDGTNTISQALVNLKIPFEIIDGDDEYTISNKTKWNDERNKAYNWLLTYKDTHFPKL